MLIYSVNEDWSKWRQAPRCNSHMRYDISLFLDIRHKMYEMFEFKEHLNFNCSLKDNDLKVKQIPLKI